MQTVNSILKYSDRLPHAYESKHNNDSERMYNAMFYDVEEALLKCFTIARTQNTSINGPVIREKAQEFAKLFKPKK